MRARARGRATTRAGSGLVAVATTRAATAVVPVPTTRAGTGLVAVATTRAGTASVPVATSPAGTGLVAVATLAAVAVALLAGTVAFACIPQARLVVISPKASGPGGSQVIVQGIGFDAAPSLSEIRWNSPDGPMLAQADNPDFALPVAIPAVPPGLYGIVVLSRGADGVLGNAARADFQVTDEKPLPGATPPTVAPGPTFAAAPAQGTSSGPGFGWLLTLAVGGVAVGVVISRGRGRSGGVGAGAGPDVVAPLADVGGDQAGPHEQGEDPAAEAQSEERLQ